MIPMEKAVETAFDSYRRLYANQGATDPLLEEIERSPDDRYWDVTIGFNTIETVVPSALEVEMARFTMPPIVGARGVDRKRLTRRYKVFRIDSNTGELATMRMKDA